MEDSQKWQIRDETPVPEDEGRATKHLSFVFNDTISRQQGDCSNLFTQRQDLTSFLTNTNTVKSTNNPFYSDYTGVVQEEFSRSSNSEFPNVIPQSSEVDNYSNFANQTKYACRDKPVPVSLRVGDQVMVRDHRQQKHTFDRVWTGPHDVITCKGDLVYEVDRDGKIINVHIDDLRPAPRINDDQHTVTESEGGEGLIEGYDTYTEGDSSSTTSLSPSSSGLDDDSLLPQRSWLSTANDNQLIGLGKPGSYVNVPPSNTDMDRQESLSVLAEEHANESSSSEVELKDIPKSFCSPNSVPSSSQLKIPSTCSNPGSKYIPKGNYKTRIYTNGQTTHPMKRRPRPKVAHPVCSCCVKE